MNPKSYLEAGSVWPFDATDAWWFDHDPAPAPKTPDWQHEAARGIVNLLQAICVPAYFDEHSWKEPDRKRLVDGIAEIIREAGKDKA
jgi:hypothetical protein